MIVRDSKGKIIPQGTPGRKYARKLDPERLKIANRNANIRGFSEKFKQPPIRRKCGSMSPTPWGQKLQAWRWPIGWYAKEAAQKIGVPFNTYRHWELGRHTPQLIVMQEMEIRMRKALEKWMEEKKKNETNPTQHAAPGN